MYKNDLFQQHHMPKENKIKLNDTNAWIKHSQKV